MTILDICIKISSNGTTHYEVEYLDPIPISGLYLKGYSKFKLSDPKKANYFLRKWISSEKSCKKKCFLSTLNHTRLPFRVSAKEFRLLSRRLLSCINVNLDKLQERYLEIKRHAPR